MQFNSPYSTSEEIANAVSHGIGTLLSVAALTLLVFYAAQQQDITRVVSFSIYGTSLITLFLFSTLYHSMTHPSAKKLFKRLDHCAIYLLIAGTYTPLMLLTLNSSLGYPMLATVWLLAFSGIIFKVKFGEKFKVISIASYLGLGFIALLCIEQLSKGLEKGGIFMLVLGGGFYSIGVIFYVTKRIPFNHAIWHLFVLAGAGSHFFMMWYYV
ncbi:hemolysin III family protein [Colwelliaceae bacterium 6441]